MRLLNVHIEVGSGLLVEWAVKIKTGTPTQSGLRDGLAFDRR